MKLIMLTCVLSFVSATMPHLSSGDLIDSNSEIHIAHNATLSMMDGEFTDFSQL